MAQRYTTDVPGWVNARIFRARRGPSRYIITAFVSVLGLTIVVGVAMLLAALAR